MGTDPEGENGEGHIDEFDESMEFDPKEIVVIEDEDGKPVNCAILMVISHEADEYALLGRVDHLMDGDRDDLEMYICRYSVDETGNHRIEPIEDEATYEAVRQAFELL